MERKHLIESERKRIAELQEPGLWLSRIAAALYVAHMTISRKILGHRQWQAGQGDRTRRTLCLFTSKCSRRRCGSAPDGNRRPPPRDCMT